MRKNPYLTKTRILIHLSVISSEFQKLGSELKDLNPESELYLHLISSKLLPARNFIDRLYKECRQIDVKELTE